MTESIAMTLIICGSISGSIGLICSTVFLCCRSSDRRLLATDKDLLAHKTRLAELDHAEQALLLSTPEASDAV